MTFRHRYPFSASTIFAALIGVTWVTLLVPHLLPPVHSEVYVGRAQVVDVKPNIFWEAVADQVLVLVLVFPHVQHVPIWRK